MDKQVEDIGCGDLPIDMSLAKLVMTQLRGELARVRIERNALTHVLRQADQHRSEQDAKITELQAELDEDYNLRERLTEILTKTVNALKGQPDVRMLHSWHDLPEWASAARAAADAGAALDRGHSSQGFEELVTVVRAWERRLAKDAKETADVLGMLDQAPAGGDAPA